MIKEEQFITGDIRMEFVINFAWDSEAEVWIATSDDIPDLVLESGSFDALLERTRFAVPELLELNASETQSYFLTLNQKGMKGWHYNG